MGRITIFSADGCRHCTRTTQALEARDMPYETISITQYPEKRKDMLSLSMRLSTPQVFFNTRHVGGADETLELLETWDRQIAKSASHKSGSKVQGYDSVKMRYKAEIENHPDPADPRFSIPNYPPTTIKVMREVRLEENKFLMPNGDTVSVLEVTETLKKIICTIGDHVQGMTLHKNSFTGADAVAALRKQYGGDDPEDDVDDDHAYSMMTQLLRQQIIHSVSDDSNTNSNGFTSCRIRAALYRLQCHHTPDILNSYCIWQASLSQREEPTELPSEILNHLTEQWQDLEFAAIDAESGRVNLRKLAQQSEYAFFEEAVCELQVVALERMANDDASKIAFGVNLYNLMVKYAQAKLGVVPETNAGQRSKFYNLIQFNVGGFLFSLQEWEHGFLRGNTRPPYAMSAPFDKNDPRRALIVQQPDARIHFALNCGARSCPPVHTLSPQHVYEELAIVAASFCEQDENVRIDHDKGQLHLSQIFRWYRPDFCDAHNKLPVAVASYSTGLKRQELEKLLRKHVSAKAVFVPYDWSPDTIKHEYFMSEKLNLSTTRVRHILRCGNGKK